jgi:hypothetical protein
LFFLASVTAVLEDFDWIRIRIRFGIRIRFRLQILT